MQLCCTLDLMPYIHLWGREGLHKSLGGQEEALF